MTPHLGTWLSQKKWILIAVGVPVLVAAWWAFRPEKLWINDAETGVSLNTLLSHKRYAVMHLRERLQSIYDEFAKT